MLQLGRERLCTGIVLAACDTEADLSIAAIAKRVGSPEHVVRRTLQLLTERGAPWRSLFREFNETGIPHLLSYGFHKEVRLSVSPEDVRLLSGGAVRALPSSVRWALGFRYRITLRGPRGEFGFCGTTP